MRREAIFADLCTLLHTHGRSHDRALGPEAHATGAVTQPPTRTHEASSILRNYGGHRPELVFRDDAMAGAAAANPEALWKLENLRETRR